MCLVISPTQLLAVFTNRKGNIACIKEITNRSKKVKEYRMA
jgi:hypothetical protein